MRQFFFARNFFRELIICTVAFQRCFAHKTAALDAELLLCNRERIGAANFCHLHALNPFRASGDKIRICRRP
jgi:hypothetical protein